MESIKVWDLPTRLFHWSLLLLMICLWWSGDAGEMDWHQIFAYTLLSLILFRILWGFCGSETSRFSHFICSPIIVIQYFKRTIKSGIKPHQGHNPLGGYMILGLLFSLIIQLATGLFATDDVLAEGPLYSLVSYDTALIITTIHRYNFDLLLILIGIHVLAVMIHMMMGDKLLQPMFSGKRRIDKKQSIQKILKPVQFAPNWQALIIFLLIFGCIGYFLIWPILAYL